MTTSTAQKEALSLPT